MIYLFLFLLSFVLTYMVKEHAIRKAILDIPNDRSSHTVPTPRGGGIAIAVTWFMGLGILYATDAIDARLFGALMVGVVLSMVSYLDDLYDLSPKLRLLVQALVALGGLWTLGGLGAIDMGFVRIENPLVVNIFAFLLIVWFVNLYNFLDGIDGYAASEAIFLALAAWALWGGAHFIVLAVAVLGFLLWNWHKAKIFMGDVGSTLLGYTVAILTLYYATIESANLWSWVVLFGLFWVDATVTLLRRWRKGEKLSQAHRKHAYQRLVQSGWAHDRVVIAGMAVNVLLLAILYYAPNQGVALGVASVVWALVLLSIEKKKGFQ
ncbi:MAG: glycosyl transferase [Sulfurovum sp. PC08-66]|nr:MAG: glycosyl transferase [Sulfurovum sp. PC08-66]KIM12470.1 MAG: glycosyl transferase [Sulfuricurvum sp. PC08-66]